MSWNVLVLDDNPKSAAEIQRGLSDVGCNVHVITDKRLLAGAKSFSRITRDQFDVVLVSVAMPRLAGLNLFDRIHRETHRRSIPVVLIGPDVSALARHEAGATPAEGYIRRPPEHDALVVELGAGLLAVVGGGTRTVPPPANTEEVQASLAVTSEVRHAQRPIPEPVLEVAEPSEVDIPVALESHDDVAASRIEELEAELLRTLELLKAAGHQLEVDRSVHHEALAAASAELEERLGEERAMGESALTSMAAELHAQSIRLGKRVSEANARAREAEARLNVERGDAATTLAQANATFSEQQRDAAKRAAAHEAELRRAQVERDELGEKHAQLEREREAERASHTAAAELAQQALDAAEQRHAEERVKSTTKLAAAASAFDRKQRELVETREAMTLRISALETELQPLLGAEKAHNERELEHAAIAAARVLAEENLAAAERRHGEEQASAASAHQATRDELALARDRAAAQERRAEDAETASRDLEERLQRESAQRRTDHELGLAALRAVEERLASLEARRQSDSGEHRAARRSMLPAEDVARPASRAPSDPGERRSASGSRMSTRLPASLEGDRDDTRPVDRRAVLLIDADRVARVNTVRALARASCEVTVRDSCVDVGTLIGGFDVVVTEVVGVAIEELVKACAERSPCAIFVWTPGVDSARALFDTAGMKDVSVLQKGNRADGLVAAVQARLDALGSHPTTPQLEDANVLEGAAR